MAEIKLVREDLVPPGPVVAPLVTLARHKVVVGYYKRALLIEFEDALFRTASSVMMPGQGEVTPDANGKVRTGAGLIASVLRYNEEHAGLKVLVAGHTDSVGSKAFNQTLSEWRAACVTSVLIGDASSFIEICKDKSRHKVSDYKQILQWAARTFNWDCDPGTVNDKHDVATTRALLEFQKAYNREGAGATRQAKIAEDGILGQETWGAFFDCYEDSVTNELGGERATLESLRQRLVFLTADYYVGCGEMHPLEAENVDEYKSQTNRRVEVVFFAPREEPRMDCHSGGLGTCEPSACELYNPARFRRRIVPGMPSALPWRAMWDEGQAKMGDVRKMQLDAPGLPAGETMTFEVMQSDVGSVAKMEVESSENSVELSFSDWYNQEHVRFAGELSSGQQFPSVSFQFKVTGAGRELMSNACVYADELDCTIRDGDGLVMAEHPCVIASPWGVRRDASTDKEGRIHEKGLPPGGVHLFLREGALLEFDQPSMMVEEVGE